MTSIVLNCGKHHQQYRIIAEYNQPNTTIALAGFCAQEQTEALLFKHLQNLCVQSDGSLTNIHSLLCGIMQQWKTAFNIPATQVLQNVHNQSQKVKSVSIYKTKVGEDEKLMNRIFM